MLRSLWESLLRFDSEHGNAHSVAMTQEQMKGFVRRAAEQPIKIRLDDGGSYVLQHPDFAFTTEGSLILANGPGHELGVEFVVCPYSHIARVEIVKRKPKIQ